MRIILGKSVVSLLDPPNEGTVADGDAEWQIQRNGYGLIVLRRTIELPTGFRVEAHDCFLAGMDMLAFCRWINAQVQ